MSAQPVDVLAVIGAAIDRAAADAKQYKFPDRDGDALRDARAAVAELIDVYEVVTELLSEIDAAVCAEHKKHGYPKSQSIAGIVKRRLDAALARVGGAP